MANFYKLIISHCLALGKTSIAGAIDTQTTRKLTREINIYLAPQINLFVLVKYVRPVKYGVPLQSVVSGNNYRVTTKNAQLQYNNLDEQENQLYYSFFRLGQTQDLLSVVLPYIKQSATINYYYYQADLFLGPALSERLELIGVQEPRRHKHSPAFYKFGYCMKVSNSASMAFPHTTKTKGC